MLAPPYSNVYRAVYPSSRQDQHGSRDDFAVPLAPGDILDLPPRIGILASTRTCGDQSS